MLTTGAVSSPHEHAVQFYESVPFLLDAVAAYVSPALHDGGAAILVALAGHRDGIYQRLAGSGLDPHAATERGQLTFFDAEATLAHIMAGDMPDAARVSALIEPHLARLSRAGRPVRVYGEMVSLLAMQGNHHGAMRLEELWNTLLQQHTFSLLCSYPIDQRAEHREPAWIGDVCAAHSRVIPAESYSALPAEADRMHAVVTLQQKARRLEAEMAERLSIEERLIAALASELTARQDARAAQVLHDALLADTAHELRNPLTSLSLNAQLLLRQLGRDQKLDPDRAETSLQAIADQAARMSRLLDRLLDVSAADATALPAPSAAAPGGRRVTHA